MASKNKTIKKAVKQLRTLLRNLNKTRKAVPQIKSLVASLIKGIPIPFNKTVPNAVFNKKLTVRSKKKSGGFNKTVYAKFNKVVPRVVFNKKVR